MVDSWWLKLERAKDHQADIVREARWYSQNHPYRISRARSRGQQPWRYQIQMTEQPDQRVALLFGDFIHSLRSALDHVVYACVPPKERSQAAFPIESVDPWKRDSRRRFAIRDPEIRKRFLRQISGIDPEAEEIIRELQPFRRPNPSTSTIGIIGRLDNADKHRRIIAFGSGIEEPTLIRVFPDGTSLSETRRTFGREYYEDGSEIYSVDDLPAWLNGHEDVEVRCSATSVIAIRIEGGGRATTRSHFRLLSTMDSAVLEVGNVLALLEPFVRLSSNT